MNARRTLYKNPVTTPIAVLVSLIAVGGMASPAQEKTIAIQNTSLADTLDPPSGAFSVEARSSQRKFIKDGRFTAGGGTASVTAVTDSIFGQGQAIEVLHPGGSRNSVMLFPNLPFALFRSTLHNGGVEATVTRTVRPLSLPIDLGRPATSLTTLGTGGLLAPDKNYGSYVWLAVAEP